MGIDLTGVRSYKFRSRDRGIRRSGACEKLYVPVYGFQRRRRERVVEARVLHLRELTSFVGRLFERRTTNLAYIFDGYLPVSCASQIEQREWARRRAPLEGCSGQGCFGHELNRPTVHVRRPIKPFEMATEHNVLKIALMRICAREDEIRLDE